MKKIFVIAFFANSFLYFHAQAQYPTTTVYTCKNGSIEAMIIPEEYSQYEKDQAIYSLVNPNGSLYPLGITSSNILAEATTKYNCHAYA
jgi:hypothetical protein